MPLKLSINYVFLALVALVLASCAEQSIPPAQQAYSTEQLLAQQAEKSLQAASTSASPAKEIHLLNAAQKYVDLNDRSRAEEVLRGLDSKQLPTEAFARYTLLYARILLANNDHFRAREHLTGAQLMAALPTLPESAQINLRRERGDLFSLLGEEDAAVVEYVELSRLLKEPDAIKNTHTKIWQILSQAPDNTLLHHATDAKGMELRGWYQLALATRQSLGDVRLQRERINQWRAQWPAHPAIFFPPPSLGRAEQAAAAALPTRIALLLPLSGNYGQAGTVIRNGFLAAYYDNLANGAQTPSVRVYDTTKQNITTLYQQAIADAAEIVIGPLRKESLAELAALDNLPIPVLALNYLDTETRASANTVPGGISHANLYQFGLSVVDEAQQVAQRAWLEGRRSALLITPATSWGDKARESFTEDWLARGGTIVSTTPYSLTQSDFSSILKPALLIDHSETRANKLQRTLGKNIESKVHRRQDIDMIFMVAQPEQGRSIKPTLDFFYAHDLPVYATSHLYTGIEDPGGNRDLEGIRFSAMPWTLPGMVTDRLIPDDSLQSAYRHLYALGIDAYQLHQRITLMGASPEAQFFGHTGTLSVAAGNLVKRSQPWGEFKNNRVRPAPLIQQEQ